MAQQSPPTHQLWYPTTPKRCPQPSRPAPGRILPAESRERAPPPGEGLPAPPQPGRRWKRGKKRQQQKCPAVVVLKQGKTKKGCGTPPLGRRRFVTSATFHSPGPRGSRTLPAARLSGSGTPPWPWPCRCPCQLYLQPAETEPSLVLPLRARPLTKPPRFSPPTP